MAVVVTRGENIQQMWNGPQSNRQSTQCQNRLLKHMVAAPPNAGGGLPGWAVSTTVASCSEDSTATRLPCAAVDLGTAASQLCRRPSCRDADSSALGMLRT